MGVAMVMFGVLTTPIVVGLTLWQLLSILMDLIPAPDRPLGPARRAAIRIGLVIGAVAAPFLAVEYVEVSTDWADADGNGLMDPMVNGGYGFLDLHGVRLLGAWGLLNTVIITATLLHERSTRRPRPDRDPHTSVNPVTP